MVQNRKIIIIGGGIAGITAAEAARKQDADASISVISREPFLPYYRLRICEVIDNPAIANSLTLHPAAWYSERRIDVMLEQHVEKIVTENNEVILSDGSRILYDALVLGSGSESFKPAIRGIDRPSVYTLWTMADALRIEVALRKVKNAVVIGGGLLGLEAGYHFRRKGIETTIVEKLPRLLANQLDVTGSEIFARRVKEFGVKVITSGDIVSIEGVDSSDDSPARHIVFADGSAIETELILVSIGVRANTFLAQSAGLAAGKRIETDDRMQTWTGALQPSSACQACSWAAVRGSGVATQYTWRADTSTIEADAACSSGRICWARKGLKASPPSIGVRCKVTVWEPK